MLHKSGLDYEYEPTTFELSDEDTYTPDFIIEGKIVIEVKGWSDERSKNRAKQFMENFSEHHYVVVGNKLPNEGFISWNQRNSLITCLNNLEERKEKIKA